MTMTANQVRVGGTGPNARVYIITADATTDTSVTIPPAYSSQVPLFVQIQPTNTTALGTVGTATGSTQAPAGLWAAGINPTTGVVTVERVASYGNSVSSTNSSTGLCRVIVWDSLEFRT